MSAIAKQLKKRKPLRKKIRHAAKEMLAGIGAFQIRHAHIPDRPVFDNGLFPWAAGLEANHAVIRRELDRILEHRDCLPKLYELQRDQYRLSADDKWKAFMIRGWGYTSRESTRLCPETARILSGIPGLQSAFFSILEPGAHIPEHRGHVRGLLRGQLALKVPRQREDCTIWVEGKPFHWDEGRLFIFDDTYLHEVKNAAAEERIVLILHFDRPMDWLGRLSQRALLFLVRRTGFYRKGLRNVEQWEQRLAELMANEARP
ncbi:MAG: aspartyl/asparaginyl beta-hydroxylase domain-containing protein [Gammaproteobacteria bacterium]|jgi:beta-hydroxylase